MRFPGPTERHAILGTTGSGKTHFGTWTLANRNYDQMPWLIIDFKEEELFQKIPRIKEISITSRLPKHAGVYVVRPTIEDIEDGKVTSLLYRAWEKEEIGLFIDEGYMINRLDKGLRTVLTQGRSKHVPVIALSQRPAWISPYLLSESEFLTTFFLQHPADIDRVNEFMYPPIRPDRLQDHYCVWYQRDGRELQYLSPCPGEAEILNMFDAKVPRRWFA